MIFPIPDMNFFPAERAVQLSKFDISVSLGVGFS